MNLTTRMPPMIASDVASAKNLHQTYLRLYCVELALVCGLANDVTCT